MDWTHHRAKVASLTRSRSADDPELVSARRSLAAANLEAYIARQLASAPPLTPEQCDRLALALRGSSRSGGAAA